MASIIRRGLLMWVGGSQALTGPVVALLVVWVSWRWVGLPVGYGRTRMWGFNACSACRNADARSRPKNTGEILRLQHSDSGGEERMSQLSSRHAAKWREWNINDESVRVAYNTPEYVSRTEGQWRCETHTSSWRVEGDALVAKEFILLLGMRRWTGVICFTVARAAAETCNTAGLSYNLMRNPHLCVTTLFFVFWSETGDVSLHRRFSNSASSNCLYNIVFFRCSQLKDHLLFKMGYCMMRFLSANRNKLTVGFFFVLFAVMGEPLQWKQDENELNTKGSLDFFSFLLLKKQNRTEQRISSLVPQLTVIVE